MPTDRSTLPDNSTPDPPIITEWYYMPDNSTPDQPIITEWYYMPDNSVPDPPIITDRSTHHNWMVLHAW